MGLVFAVLVIAILCAIPILIGLLEIPLTDRAEAAGCLHLFLGFAPFFAMPALWAYYGYYWLKYGKRDGFSLEDTIRWMGLQDPFLNEASWVGLEKLNQYMLGWDVSLWLGWAGLFSLSFVLWFSNWYCDLCKQLRGKYGLKQESPYSEDDSN